MLAFVLTAVLLLLMQLVQTDLQVEASQIDA